MTSRIADQKGVQKGAQKLYQKSTPKELNTMLRRSGMPPNRKELNSMIRRTGIPPGRQLLMRLFLTRLRRYGTPAPRKNQHVLHALLKDKNKTE